jgi:hypothetical protein
MSITAPKYRLKTLSVVNLIVCNDQLNWPDPDHVPAINDAMYAQA